MHFLAKCLYVLFLFFAITVLIIPATRTVRSDSVRQTAPPPTAAAARPQIDYTRLPLSFEANLGQTDRRVRFVSRNSGYNLFLTEGEAVLSLAPCQGADSAKRQAVQPSVVRIRPEGANRRAFIEGRDRPEAKSHYLVGRDQAKWRADVPHYAKVYYRSVYPGIDQVYYGNQRQLEYDFILSPGADAARIRLAIGGAKKIRIDANGDLLIDTPAGLIRQLAPKAYQEIDGTRREVASRYVLVGKHKVGFALGEYDRGRPLLIDPVLNYSTLLGGTGTGGDWGNSVAVDGDGNIYVAGYTTSLDFPTTPGALQRTFGGGDTVPLYDAFVTKINPSGTGTVYSTYLGGGGSDVADAIAVDASGQAYVSGSTTSTNFPVSAGAYQSTCRGRSDAFVVKLDPAGAAPVYSTYLGGSHVEFGGGLAVDGAGNAFVAGRTYSNNFPVTSGASQTSLNRGMFCYECEDGFVTKLNPAGTGLVYSTFLGGSANDYLMGLALGADGSVYLTGSTLSWDFPSMPGAFQETKSDPYGSDSDVFVTRLSPSGNVTLYSTFIGSTESETAYAIAVDSAGNAFVTGITNSPGFPTTPGAFQTSMGSATANTVDGFVCKLNATGMAMVYSTFLGGEKDDEARDVALDAAGNAVVVGATTSSAFPTSADAFQRNLGGYRDAFVTRLNASGSQALYSTFIGDAGWDGAASVALDAQARAYVTGGTYSAQFPVTQGNPWNARPGESDVFVARIDLNEPGYRVSGRVTNNLGNPLLEVAISVAGSLTHTVYTDSHGYYSIGGLPAGANLTLSANRYGTTYSPAGVNLANLSQDETVDFSGPSPLWITGRIVDNLGAGVITTVTLSGSSNDTTQTDIEGRYYFRNLSAGGDYTVTPTSNFLTFSPASASAQNLEGDKVFDFTATPPPSIGGRVINEYGSGMGYVTVTLSGSMSLSMMTDEAGYYKFWNLPAGGNYTVTPSPIGPITFNPASQTVDNLTSDQTFNFTYLYPIFLHGQITDQYGSGLSGISVSLDGTTSATTTTGSGGYYYFPDLTRGGTYTVTPSHPLYNFTPSSATITNMAANETRDFTAAYRQFTISGQVTTYFGPLPGAAVILSGFRNATTQTDSNGNYSFTGLAIGEYTVTPSKPGHVFTPVSTSFAYLAEDSTANFLGQLTHAISGRVMDSGGAALGGVSVELTGTSTGTAQTDANGNYSFTDLVLGDYTVTPSLTHYAFAPASRSFAGLSGDQTADFTGTLLRHDIRGRVVDSGGAALTGVTITLSGSQSGTATTDANGDYLFASLPAGGNYTLTCAKPYYVFSPASISFDDLSNNQSAGFTGTRLTYSISGRVANSANVGQAGVTVTLAGGQSASAQTDAAGNYTFAALPAGYNYTVTPTKNHYSFTPASRTFDGLSGNQTADFTSTLLSHDIGGRIVDAGGAALAGASVSAWNGSQQWLATTDANGNYVLAGLPAGGNYTVTASKPHYSLDPLSRSFNDLSGNQTADFTGTLLRHDIRGRVVDSGGAALGGVTVTLSGGQGGTATTDANGDYLFASLAAGVNYTVTPAKPYYVFSPASQSYLPLGGSQTANFTGTRLTYSITGRVTEGAAGLAGVSVALGGGQSGTVQTDAAGNFAFTGLPAGFNYSVTPTHPYFAFSPAFYAFPALGQNQAANFNAVRLTYQVSGTVADACAQAIAGATLTLSHDSVSVTTQTNASGFYQFTGVPAGFNYTLVPSKTGYSFAPASAGFSGLNANRVANFTGTPPPSTMTVQPTADAYVRAGSSASSNFGTNTQLITRLASTANNSYETYLTFDVGQVCTVSSVKLRLYGKLNNSGNLAVSAYAVANTAWTETSITWNNRPATGALLRTTTVTSTTNAWYEWDITSYVQGEISAGRRVISIALQGAAVTSNQATFNSRQATSNKPGLVVTNP